MTKKVAFAAHLIFRLMRFRRISPGKRGNSGVSVKPASKALRIEIFPRLFPKTKAVVTVLVVVYSKIVGDSNFYSRPTLLAFERRPRGCCLALNFWYSTYNHDFGRKDFCVFRCGHVTLYPRSFLRSHQLFLGRVRNRKHNLWISVVFVVFVVYSNG